MKTCVYTIRNLDCANCAAKAEAKIQSLPGVQEAVITYATMQLRLTAEDPDALLQDALAAARTIEPDILFEKSAASSPQQDGHTHSKRQLLLGSSLFAAGLLLQGLGLDWISLVCFLPAYGILGWEILRTAGKNLLTGHVMDENFLMSIATIGALIIGEFPEAVGVMLFYRVGEFFEEIAVSRSRSQIMEAVDLRPEVVQLISGATIPAAEAEPGDYLIVRPGDRIPLDGTVFAGESRIDTAPITGEPVPVRVAPGSKVTSGCVNVSGQLTIRVDKALSESMVSRILNSVENAAASKPKFERFISRFARVYTPIVVGLAAFVAIVPSIVTGDWNYWVYTALSFLVMSCPCALVLSVPLAFFSGIGVGGKMGILFKGGIAMEALAAVKTVVMDKTGTLTHGDFTVKSVAGGHEILQLCASCEQNSNHPIAKSIVTCARQRKMALFTPDTLEEIAGRGIRATADGKRILCGNQQLLMEHNVTAPAVADSGTVVYVAVDDRFLGYILIADTVKDGAAEAVAQLHRMQLRTAILTGDNAAEAEAVARKTGVPQVFAKLLPDEKLEKLQAIRKTSGSAMFVGDGINDAPVLAGADVGAAMGSGADAAIEAADVVFLTSDVSAIPASIDIARRTRRIALQNVIFALSIKLVVMALGLAGHASMWAAVFADSGVALLCVLNSVRLLYRKK